MLPNDVRKLRERIIHTQFEFAELLSRLRGVSMSWRTVEGWESGRHNKPLPLYQTDVAAIENATTPHGPKCGLCGVRAVVRKNDTDLCGECATPMQWGREAKTKKAFA